MRPSLSAKQPVLKAYAGRQLQIEEMMPCACSRKELLQADNKLHCTGCNSYQEGYKWVEIVSFPPVLIIHFNRFAFTPMLEQGHKLKQRITFPNRLTPPPDVHSSEQEGIVYELTAVVVHVGTMLAHGACHYRSLRTCLPFPPGCCHS
jgi:ubiquitin C-terminal hydrolase